MDAKESLALKAAANVCPSSAAFISLINEAQRRLMRRGSWFDLEQVVSFCVSGCVIAWPRWVGTVLGVRFGKCWIQTPSIYNNYWSFMGPHPRGENFRGNTIIQDANLGPCANEVSGTTGKVIRYYVVHKADVGKTITLFGNRYGNQPLQEKTAGIWQNGITIAAASPFGTNAALVTRIEAITRQPTAGMAYLYEYDPDTGLMRDLAVFEPNETNPRNRRSRIANAPHGTKDANGICWTTVEALIKLQFIPVANDRDFLMIDNFDALKFMIQAIKAEESNDDQGAEVKIAKAIRELNFDLDDKLPKKQVPVNMGFGRTICSPI
jgi:hypothetical protein